ncbi:MAG: ATP-binding protein [Elioraea sp.]|nr:ATP-binding protein [Elioraea sp.]MDW8444570.1 ATP-binding protein [Acetobacteraceae bacterium]
MSPSTVSSPTIRDAAVGARSIPSPAFDALGVAGLLEAAIAAVPTGVTVADPALPDCPIVYVNSAFTRMTGYAPEEVLGRNCRFLQGARTDPAAVAQVREAIARRAPITVELLNYRKDGTRFWNELHIAPVFDRDGALTAFIGIQHDVTARKKAEAGRERARRLAERANRTKSDFLAAMSHEIRTPMNGVMGTLALLLETELDAEQRAYAETARQCGKDLLAIINDILDISRIEAGKLVIEQVAFRLAEVVRAVLDLAAAAAAEKGLKLEARIAPDVPDTVIGDPLRLKQVLTNLVDNAVKFTAVGGVTVTIDRLSDRDGLAFAVTDTGIGIPASVQKRLFSRFAQADPSITRRFGGSGLGLTICRRLVSLMGGEIGLDSEPGRGSTFRFVLPLRAAEGAGPAPERVLPDPSPPKPPAARGRVLIAEDSRTNQLVAAAMLRRAGWRVDIVSDGREAVRRAAETDYALILMDVQMPELDGLAAARRIRALPGARGQVPILAVSGATTEADRRACAAAGMNGFLPKPIDRTTLLDAVEAVLADRRAPQPLPSPPPPAPPPELAGRDQPLIDRAVLADLRCSVEPGRLPKLLALFAEETEARLARIAEAVARHDLDELARLAHTLKSSAGAFGAAALARAVSALEEEARAGRAEAAAHLAGEVAVLARASLAALISPETVG